MRLSVLVVLPICCVFQCASATAEAGMSSFHRFQDVIAPLLERRVQGDSSVSSSALNVRDENVGLSRSRRQKSRKSRPSVKGRKKLSGQQASGASRASRPSKERRCNPSAKSIRAWDMKEKESISYGGEEAYPVPRNIYKTDAVVKQIIIDNSVDEIVARQQLAVMDEVGQLRGWSIMHQGEQQIWIVVQKRQGMPANLAAESLNDAELKRIQKQTRNWYAERYHVRLPGNVEDDQKRYSFNKVANQWIGMIVGWKGGESIHAPILYTEPRKICLEYCKHPDDLALAWDGRQKLILYGGEGAYPVPEDVYKTPAVIRRIFINNEADEVVARQQIAILKKVGQFLDWGIMGQGEQRTWLVAQTWRGVPAETALLRDNRLNHNELKNIQERERTFYASISQLRLPEDAATRFSYIQAEDLWTGVVVVWKGVESIPAPVLLMRPEVIC